MKIFDSASLKGVQETPEGYLEASVRIARTGIQLYRGAELGRPTMDTVRVYRGDDAVFDKESLSRFANLPLTVEHPAELVDSRNWKKHAVGTTGNEILRDGEFLKIGIRVTDADAVEAIKSGKREVSVGYEAMFDWTPGVTPEGEPYDARQTKVVANHIAITDSARAGSMARIGDSWGVAPINDANPYRHPAGSSKGGQFAPKGTGGSGAEVDSLSPSAKAFVESATKRYAKSIQSGTVAITGLVNEYEGENDSSGTKFVFKEVNIRVHKKRKNGSEAVEGKNFDYDGPIGDKTHFVIAGKAEAMEQTSWVKPSVTFKDSAGNGWEKDFNQEEEGTAVDTKAVVLGDSTVTVVDTDAEKVEKVDKDLKAKDKSIAEKDAEIARLKKSAVKDSDIDRLVEERAKLVADARTIVEDMDVAGKSALQIKREVVTASKQFPVSDSTTDAYIEAAFDILATSGKTAVGDSVRSALLSSKSAGADPWGRVVDSMVQSKKEAW